MIYKIATTAVLPLNDMQFCFHEGTHTYSEKTAIFGNI